MEPREFFDTLESRVDASQTAGVNKSYVFDIDGAGVWKVDVTDAGAKVTEGATDGDVTIRASEETFRALVNKEQSPTTVEGKFFGELKDRTSDAYYSSKIGLHDDLEYKGNVLQEEYSGTDVSKS